MACPKLDFRARWQKHWQWEEEKAGNKRNWRQGQPGKRRRGPGKGIGPLKEKLVGGWEWEDNKQKPPKELEAANPTHHPKLQQQQQQTGPWPMAEKTKFGIVQFSERE
jgi:hypothetical protein